MCVRAARRRSPQFDSVEGQVQGVIVLFREIYFEYSYRIFEPADRQSRLILS
jgi:hypothetical protein